MSSTGKIAPDLTTDTVNGDKFFDFLRASLIPNMMEFNGMNPLSIVIMDNCSVHHVEEVTELLRQAGIVLFLPPYIPDLNPIEEILVTLWAIQESTMNCSNQSLPLRLNQDAI